MKSLLVLVLVAVYRVMQTECDLAVFVIMQILLGITELVACFGVGKNRGIDFL